MQQHPYSDTPFHSEGVGSRNSIADICRTDKIFKCRRVPGKPGRACASFDSESLDFSSDFLSLVHRFLFFLACKYGIIP